MKKVKRFQLKIVIFSAVKKSLYIAWGCFRNGIVRCIYREIEAGHEKTFGVSYPVPNKLGCTATKWLEA